MTRIAHVLRELGRNLLRHPGTAVSSLLSLTLLFLLFDLFWLAARTSASFYEDILSGVRVEVFLEEGVVDSSLQDLGRGIYAIDGVMEAEFVSKEEARERLAAHLGIDPLVGYDSLNPLPRSYLLTMEIDYLNPSDMEATEAALRQLPGVMDVAYSRGFLEKVEETRNVLVQIGLGLGALILLASLISSANSIRLMTRARAVGFRQMALLGAGKLFVGMPFLIEGFLLAVLAAAASWGIVLYGHSRVSFTEFVIVMPTYREMAIYCLAAGMVGFVSGYLGIRRLLK